jgi:glycosyltransferase involved in cell wall biosynthesis
MFQTLYLCYFGLREPLVQTQVLPYLRELKKMDALKINLLTFEPNFKKKWTSEEIEIERKNLEADGIVWHALPYHKSPSIPATIYDLLNGLRLTVKLARKEKIDIFHARGHTPAPIAAIAKTILGGKMLFDIRGFMPEEFTDAGVWRATGLVYKSVKKVEKWLMKKADGFIVLTEKAREILFPESAETGFDEFGRPVEVIPCCIDKKRFEAAETLDRETLRSEMTLRERKVFIYVGSLSGSYLIKELAGFFLQARRQNPGAFLMILTQRDVEKVRNILLEAGLSENDFLIECVSHDEVPRYLRAADIAVSFLKSGYSKQSASLTKIAEYLAAGLPIAASSGVGDLDDLIEGENVGAILRGFLEKDFSDALEKIDELLKDVNLREHCHKTAYKYYDLETVGGEKYRGIYKKLLQN